MAIGMSNRWTMSHPNEDIGTIIISHGAADVRQASHGPLTAYHLLYMDETSLMAPLPPAF